MRWIRIDGMIDLRHGDCLELMRDIPDGSVDLVLCDLPYGTTECAWDSVIPFAPLWENWHRVCKENAAVVLFCHFRISTSAISHPYLLISKSDFSSISKKIVRTRNYIIIGSMLLPKTGFVF